MATGPKRGKRALRPSEEAHRQVVELLQLADRSANTDIRAAAIEIAKNTSASERVRAVRVSSATIMVAATLVVLGAIAGSWYALVRYPGTIGRSISGSIIVIAAILIALYALLSGHLSQDNFTKLWMAAWEWGKSISSLWSRAPIERLSASAVSEDHPKTDNS